MLYGGLCLLLIGTAAVSAEITASDLPQCAIECYCEAGEKVKIPITAYKEQCLSAPFQLAIRECAAKSCTKEEYEFTEYQAAEYCKSHGVDIVQVLAAYDAEQSGDFAETSETEKTFEIEGGDGGPAVEPTAEDDPTVISPPDVQATSTCTKCTSTAAASGTNTGEPTTTTAVSGTMSRKVRKGGYYVAIAIFALACFL